MAIAQEQMDVALPKQPSRVLTRSMMTRLRRNRSVVLAVGFLLLLTVFALFGEFLGIPSPTKTNPKAAFAAPSRTFWFGTDELGRDLFARTVFGARVSLAISAIVVTASAGIGVPFGLIAGYVGGKTDTVLMRLMDVILAFPSILLALGLIAVMGQGFLPATVAVTVVSIPGFARLMRASALSEKEQEYVLAARSIGCSPPRLMVRTLLPNCLAPVIVQAAFIATWAVLLEAGLSFLGLGVRPPTPSWGQMLSQSKVFLYRSPWYGLFPGITLTLVVLSLYTLGDAAQRRFGRTRESLL